MPSYLSLPRSTIEALLASLGYVNPSHIATMLDIPLKDARTHVKNFPALIYDAKLGHFVSAAQVNPTLDPIEFLRALRFLMDKPFPPQVEALL